MQASPLRQLKWRDHMITHLPDGQPGQRLSLLHRNQGPVKRGPGDVRIYRAQAFVLQRDCGRKPWRRQVRYDDIILPRIFVQAKTATASNAPALPTQLILAILPTAAPASSSSRCMASRLPTDGAPTPSKPSHATPWP